MPEAILLVFFSLVISNCNKGQVNHNWTQFRGNNLSGISGSSKVPVGWNDSTNVAWRTAIHGVGWSSPVVMNNLVWITTANEDGKALFAICIDFSSGKILYDIKLREPDSVYSKHAINSYATPTPCIEEGFVYLHFGVYGTFCADTKTGEIVWQTTDYKCDHVQGPASSPIIYKNLLILHFEGVDVQYLVALDKKTGKLVWRADRPGEPYEQLAPIGRKAYITPIIIQVDGKDVLISNGSAVCCAYDPATGKEIWRIVEGEDSTVSSPFTENGIVYFYTSFVTASDGEKYIELFSVNPKGKGDIGKTNIIWKLKSPPFQLLTPVIKDGLIYTVDTKNQLICIDAKDGSILWSEKLKGSFNSSPVIAGGKVYFSSTRGNIFVIKEGKKFDLVAENKLSGQIWATPAIVENSILIRTSKFLYKIAE